MLLKRSYEKEIMDDFSITDERIENALDELKIVNKYLGGNKTSGAGMKYLFNGTENKIKILDVGSGGSDSFDILKDKYKIEIICLDINKGACRYVKRSSPSKNIVCGDARALPFKKSTFDVVHTSLFLHHFNEKSADELLKSFLDVSKIGVVINDLRRSIIAFIGIKFLTGLFSKSAMLTNDAPLSVKRGFLKSDLENILTQLKYSSSIIKHKWAFRWLAVIRK